jgi:hypothetical protein
MHPIDSSNLQLPIRLQSRVSIYVINLRIYMIITLQLVERKTGNLKKYEL